MSRCGSKAVPTGMPDRAGKINGKTRLASIERHTRGKVWSCAITEQIKTSDAATGGDTT